MVAARACCWTLELPAAAAGCHPVVKSRIKKAEKNNKRRDTQTSNYYYTIAQISLRELGPFVLCVCPLSLICGSFLFCSYIVPTVNKKIESRVLSYPLCVCVCAVYVYMHVRVHVLSVRIKWGPSASSLRCFLFCFFFSLYTKWAETPWIRKQLGGDLRRDRRCKTHKRPVVKTENENQRRRNEQPQKIHNARAKKSEKTTFESNNGGRYINYMIFFFFFFSRFWLRNMCYRIMKLTQNDQTVLWLVWGCIFKISRVYFLLLLYNLRNLTYFLLLNLLI